MGSMLGWDPSSIQLLRKPVYEIIGNEPTDKHTDEDESKTSLVDGTLNNFQ